MHEIGDVLAKYNEHAPEPGGAEKIICAYKMAEKAHRGQVRKSKHPYIVHPVAVAYMLAKMGLDWQTVCAALLHDTLEDTELDPNLIELKLGSTVLAFVQSLTKIKTAAKAHYREKQKAEIESMRKIILGSHVDLRVVLIKLCDRLHNLRTLSSLSRSRQKVMAKETMAIYAPFANRLGLALIYRELENLCFKYLKHKDFMKISQRIAISKSFYRQDINLLKTQMTEALAESNIPNRIYDVYLTPYQIYLRQKRRIYRKLLNIEIITEKIDQCYLILGILHRKFIAIPGLNIKDFIAIPRSNGYQAIHTRILFNENPYSIHIRTNQMDKIARYGILATKDSQSKRIFHVWFSELKNIAREEADSQTFIQGIKVAAEADRIYVCTPQGDYWSFPSDAIILDFAYRVHTDVGHHCHAVYVDDQIGNIYDELKHGSVVKIITSEDAHPKPEWLNRVKTPRARSAIRLWLESQKRLWSTSFGRKMLEADFKRVNLDLSELIETPEFKEAIEKIGVKDTKTLFSQIGSGKLSTRNIIAYFVTEKSIKKALDPATYKIPLLNRFSKSSKTPIYQITQLDSPHIKLSRCCNPLPGDEVMGLLSKKHQLSIHRKDCPVIKKRNLPPENFLKLEWALKESVTLPAQFILHTKIHPDIPIHILETLRKINVSITQFKFDQTKSGSGLFTFKVNAITGAQADIILTSLSRMKGIEHVKRI